MKAIIASLAIGGLSASAQNPDTAKLAAEQRTSVSPVGSVYFQAPEGEGGVSVSGAPYSADAVTEKVQTLMDGNRIVQTSSGMVARDGQGRVRRDESLGMVLPGSKGETAKLETIDDPVTGMQWRLDPQLRIAVKMIHFNVQKPPALFSNFLAPPGPEKTWFYSSGAPGSQLTMQTLAKRKAEADTDASRVDLGTRTVEGLPAKGTRVTRTLAAGAVGNEQPLTITTETWYSPDLKVLVMSKSEDPRMGVTTYRLTNIRRSEPDASLFEVPADYTVRDQPGGMLIFNEGKKE